MPPVSAAPLAVRCVVVLATALPLASCAPSSRTLPPPPSPAEVPRLRAALTANPDDAVVRFRLAEAYRLDDRPEAARLLLEPVLEAQPAAAFYLGLVHEELGRPGEARRLYQDYLERGQSDELRAQVRDRLGLLERAELRSAVREALSQEQELATTLPARGTVGVFPFLVVTDEPELRPLGTALAELLTTDLAQTDRLTVLERAQVGFLLDEMRLGESERVDPATAARSGRILGAGSLVQGRVEGGAGEVALQAAVLRVPTDTAAGDPVTDEDELSRIFDLEKRLALTIYERLGIQLTPAERERVLRVPTANVQALIAFGFGLEAQDAGQWDDAAAHFVRALQLDPGFDLARASYEEAVALNRAEGTDRGALGRLGALETGELQEWQSWDSQFDVLDGFVVDPGERDAVVDAFDLEGLGRHATVEIVIVRPGGGS